MKNIVLIGVLVVLCLSCSNRSAAYYCKKGEKQKELKNAVRYYKLALLKDPNFAKAYNLFGQRYRFTNDSIKIDSAIILFKKSLDINAKQPFVWNALGEINCAKFDHRTALEYFNIAIRRIPLMGLFFINAHPAILILGCMKT